MGKPGSRKRWAIIAHTRRKESPDAPALLHLVLPWSRPVAGWHAAPGRLRPREHQAFARRSRRRRWRRRTVPAGHFDQSAQAWLALASQYGERADHYRVLAAEAWSQEGRIDAAAPTLAKIKRENLHGDDAVRFDLLRADLALHRHDAATALRLTTQPTVAVPEALQLRLFELRARAQAATGDHWGAARTRVQMDDHLQGLDRAENRKVILSELAQLDVASLKRRAAAMQPGDRMLPWVDQALSQHGITVAQPTPTLQQPVGTLLPGAGAEVREGYRMPARVALLLPQSGPYAAAGNTIAEGFFAAYAEAAHTHAPRASVRIYDTQGSVDGANKAYRQAVADGAQLVVGRSPVARSRHCSPSPRCRCRCWRSTIRTTSRLRPAAPANSACCRKPRVPRPPTTCSSAA